MSGTADYICEHDFEISLLRWRLNRWECDHGVPKKWNPSPGETTFRTKSVNPISCGSWDLEREASRFFAPGHRESSTLAKNLTNLKNFY